MLRLSDIIRCIKFEETVLEGGGALRDPYPYPYVRAYGNEMCTDPNLEACAQALANSPLGKEDPEPEEPSCRA